MATIYNYMNHVNKSMEKNVKYKDSENNAKNIETKKLSLKRCPHCRAWNSMTLIPIKNSGYKVMCDYSKGGCGASGGMGKTKEEAIRMWNLRTPMDHLKHELNTHIINGGYVSGTCIVTEDVMDLVDDEQEKFIELNV